MLPAEVWTSDYTAGNTAVSNWLCPVEDTESSFVMLRHRYVLGLEGRTTGPGAGPILALLFCLFSTACTPEADKRACGSSLYREV